MSTSNPQPLKAVSLLKIDQILGLAVFDPMGLPRDYFITSQHPDTEWVQLVFQSLGLQQLVAATMDLPELEHALIRTKIGNIIVVFCQKRYIALLVKRALPQERPQIDGDLVDWICDFEATVVRTHTNFRSV
ncbi:hypothetical protein [Leptothoe sp. PORK10 BA2]|uniref:hypothetical protein n=1 Tax=Leptothoe sp. PORK10 BA2 TaxID=3110254 RepID=UPI002B1EABA0|nr:hypothetical protein [Leptothoe sp. PORK10 BA2]MEA5462174.1 hypothetical protein [Leptothoe sp. PORK10 BA2]